MMISGTALACEPVLQTNGKPITNERGEIWCVGTVVNFSSNNASYNSVPSAGTGVTGGAPPGGNPTPPSGNPPTTGSPPSGNPPSGPPVSTPSVSNNGRFGTVSPGNSQGSERGIGGNGANNNPGKGKANGRN